MNYNNITKQELIEKLKYYEVFVHTLWDTISDFTYDNIVVDFISIYIYRFLQEFISLYNIDPNKIKDLEEKLNNCIDMMDISRKINYILNNIFFEDIFDMVIYYKLKTKMFNKNNVNKYKDNVLKFIDELTVYL